MPQVKIIQVDPRKLKHLPTKNPNVMDPATYEALVESMKTDGFLQPVLVVKEGKDTLIIDGVHRSKAAAQIGLDKIPAVLAEDRERAEILRIALNKMRGELDISEVSRQMQVLLDIGFDKDDLQLTGFQGWEIEAMLENLNADEDDALLGAVTAPIEPERPKTFNLTLKFTTESERARVREALEEAGDGDAVTGIGNLANWYHNR